MAHDRHVLWDAKAVALEHVDATTGELVVAADDGIEGHVTRQPDLFRVSLASHQIIYRPTYYAGGRVEQEDLLFLGAVYGVVREVVRQAKSAGASAELVAVTSQRSSIAPIAVDGRALIPFVMWQDTRNASLMAQLVQSNDRIFALSGTMVNTVLSGTKIGWIEREQLEVARAATRYVTIPELLIHEMCDVWAIDKTYASRSNATFRRNLTCGSSMRAYCH